MKININENNIKYNALHVAKGNLQKKGVDNIHFCFITKSYSSIRALIALAAYHRCKIFSIDVEIASLPHKIPDSYAQYIKLPPALDKY